MASFLAEFVSHGTDLEGLDEETATRSVLIHGIPAQVRDEDIIIHFQKGKNGGGEIDHVRIAGDGKAVITFNSCEVAQTVLGHQHFLKGSELALTPYRLISKKPPEVFEQVTARVNLMAFQLSSQESREFLKRAQQETNVAWHEACDGFILSGTFDQVETCRQRLQSFIVRPAHSELQLAEERRDQALEVGGRRESQQNASERCNENENFDHSNISFDVQPQFMKLLKRAYEKELQEMEKKFAIGIVWDKDATRVEIRTSEIEDAKHFQDGCDAFINLYQNVFPDMKRELIAIADCSDDAAVQQVINAVMAKNPVLIEKIDTGELSMYGQKSGIGKAIDDLKRELGKAKDGSQNSRRVTRSKHDGPSAPTDGCDFPQRDVSSPPKALKHELFNGVMISLHQGDITDQRVDAIVNAANERLQHGGGVAGAILAKGGRQIKEDSRQVLSRRKTLEVGKAVHTRGGNLTSKFVIHAVGPRWEEHGRDRSMVLLRRACVESLRLAGSLNLSSVALPAISSGIFGMPKDVCAKVMFDAVEEYSTSVDVLCCNLRDVRIVIIDAPTVVVFHEEFVKRYLSSQERLQMRSNLSGQFTDEKLPTGSTDMHGDQHETSNISLFVDNKNMGSSNQGKQFVTDQTAVSHEDHQQYSSKCPSVDKKSTRESDGSLKAIAGKDEEESKAALSSKRNYIPQTDQTADKDGEAESFLNVKNADISSKKIQDAMPNSEKEHKNVADEITHTQNDKVTDSGTATSVNINVKLSQGDRLAHGNSDQTRKVEAPKGPHVDSRTPSSAENVRANGKVSQGDGLSHGNSDGTGRVETTKGPLLDSRTPHYAENVSASGKISQGDSLPHGNSDGTGKVVALKGSIGRGRGALAVCFPPKINENERCGSIPGESRGSSTIPVPRNITVGRGRGLTVRSDDGVKNPPGLIVTSEELDFAKNLEEQRDPVRGATPVTNGKNTEPEQSNENRGVVGGQKPSSIPDSAHDVPTCRDVSSSDSKTATGNTATSGPAAGDKRPESGHDSNAPNNTSGENANTIKHCNANPSQDSALADGGKITQSSVSEDDAPRNKREQTALAVAGIMHEEHEEKLGRETSCQPETHGLSNPSCDRIVSHANSKRPFKDQPLYGGKFQKLECNAETPQSPGSVDHSLMADDKASESVVASFDAETPVKSEEKHDTPIEKVPANEETKGDLLQNSNQSNLSQEENKPAPKATRKGMDSADGYIHLMATSDSSKDPAPQPLHELEVVHPNTKPSQSECSVRQRSFNDLVHLPQCGHTSCKSCLEQEERRVDVCSLSSKDFTHNDIVPGKQPFGHMTWRTESRNALPGYEAFQTIVINYNILDGVQGSEHPNPGKPFQGVLVTAYLPENSEGLKVLELLRRAFHARLLFTIGTCSVTGVENQVLWNSIEHKTNLSGGPANFGYPDPSYLDRVRSQLAEKGLI